MSATGFPIELEHPIYGLCRLLRVEGMNWVVEVEPSRNQLRIPITRRAEFSLVQVKSSAAPVSKTPLRSDGFSPGKLELQQLEGDKSATQQARSPLQPEPSPPPVHISATQPLDKIRLRKAIESLRNGLPPVSIEAHKLAVGLEGLDHKMRELLHQVSNEGGAVKIVRGAYGQGKTISLNIAAELAIQNGYWVAQTEVDASDRRLDKPSNIYRSLMQSLLIPGARLRGVAEVATRVSAITRQKVGVDANHYHRNIADTRTWLEKELECPPLAWLLSDPDLPNKEMLRGLLDRDAGWSIVAARKQHSIPGGPRDWPKFSAGSQGDFACFLLSGLGRLARLLGHKGLIVILDEMEKWQDLSWSQQPRAGNLIGGLIWGATEQEGRRERSTRRRPNYYQPEALQHSGWVGGFPFTTLHRSHLGLVIALTPRGDEGPEKLWGQFGPIDIFDLPEFTQANFSTYISTASAHYAAAYDLPQPNITNVSRRAHALWNEFGDGSTRTAVRSTIQALDEWRESLSA